MALSILVRRYFVFQTNSSSSSFGFSLLGVATARQYSPFHSIYFLSFPSSNPFHVFSHQIHPPLPWPSSFPSVWHRHLHHPFPHVVFFFPFYVSIPTYPYIPKFVSQLCNFRGPSHVFVSYLVLSCTPSAHFTIFNLFFKSIKNVISRF